MDSRRENALNCRLVNHCEFIYLFINFVMLIAPITITTAVGASRNICHEMLLIYEWTQKPQPQPQWQRWRQRRAPEAQNVLIIKIQNGGREGEEEGEGKVKLQRTLNLVGSQFTSLRFPSLFHSPPWYRYSVALMFNA